jgi:ribosomal protein S18 acetylase RimI-like enzyme
VLELTFFGLAATKSMDLNYYKRYRMEIDLFDRDLNCRPLPQGYHVLPWDDSLLEAFALAKYNSFRGEIDANVFPCLGDLNGCRRLMSDIVHKPGFLAQAAWLAIYSPDGCSKPEYCGTIQGIRDKTGLGAVQNLGVTPEHRDLGLGTCLLFHSLDGFRRSAVRRVFLEVTAQNTGAIRLYHRSGFITTKTVYKAAEPTYST